MRTKEKKREESKQKQLFYNRPLAKAIPDRTLSKNEVLMSVWVKNCIQTRYESEEEFDLDQPLLLQIDIGEIAKQKGITSSSGIAMFKKRMFESAEKMIGSSAPSEWVLTTENGKKKKTQLPLYSSLSITEDGTITIKTSVEFQKYFILRALQHPELQVNLDFYLQAKSQYSYGLMNLLLAEIAERRIESSEYQGEYDIVIDYDDIRQKLPPANANYPPNNYKDRVINAAIKDINSNPFSQIQISMKKISGAHGALKAFSFHVILLQPFNHLPTFTVYPNSELIDPITKAPHTQYLEARMRQLGVDESFIKWAFNNRTGVMIASALFHTMANANNARFFNAVLRKWNPQDKSIQDYATELKDAHPELVDDVIASIIPPKKDVVKHKSQPREEEKLTPETSEFLQEFLKTTGHLPKGYAKES